MNRPFSISSIGSFVMVACLMLGSKLLLSSPFKLHHSIDIGMMQSFNPGSSFQVYTINPYVDFWYNRYKKYSYPALRLRYSVSHSFLKGVETGLEIGATFRYQQRVAVDNYFTFYSFPICVKASGDLFSFNQNKSLQASCNAGYTYKHPKNKYWDGTGGYIVSASIGYHNKLNRTCLQLGYEIEQSKEYFLYKPELYSQAGDLKTYSFHRIVNGIYLSMKVDIH